MFNAFSHFLAYGSTDQETLRELTGEYEGLTVPGTFAAFQAEGTRGFVLTLSAAIQKPYIIDPRTPLFQYRNPDAKQSHLALARVLELSSIVASDGWVPFEKWTPELISRVAAAWVAFNTAYTSIAPKQFDKYARRLGHKPQIANANTPAGIIAPYLMEGVPDQVSGINEDLWSSTVRAATGSGIPVRRVIAATSASILRQRALSVSDEELIVWMDNLEEVDTSNASRLAEYAVAIRDLSLSGKRLFALYGGFFAAALRTVGLVGASHGVGFSEHRDHVELKSSGGAPARFYVQRIHRYLPVEVASELWRQNPALVQSYYPGYVSREPGEYTYHALMKHSVMARSDEIRRLSAQSPRDVARELRSAKTAYLVDLASLSLSTPIERRVVASLNPLPVWADALEGAA